MRAGPAGSHDERRQGGEDRQAKQSDRRDEPIPERPQDGKHRQRREERHRDQVPDRRRGDVHGRPVRGGGQREAVRAPRLVPPIGPTVVFGAARGGLS